MAKEKVGSFRPHGRVFAQCYDDRRTRSEFRDECDVNVIMKKYRATGLLPGDPARMKYGEFSDVPDFMTAMNVVARANEAFAALPAHIRKRFGNDPAEFCNYVANPENIDEVRRLGLAEVPKAPVEAPLEPKAPVPPEPAKAAPKPVEGAPTQ